MARALLIAFLAGCSARDVADAEAPFCPQTGALLCADFQSGSDPGAGWSGVQKRGTAAGGIESGAFVASVPTGATTTSAFAPYVETMDRLGEVEIAFLFRADVLPAILTIAAVAYQKDQYAVALQIAHGNLYIIEQRAGITDSPWVVGRIAVGEWHAYGLVVSPTRRKLEAWIDDKRVSNVVAASKVFDLGGKKLLSVGIVDSSVIVPQAKVEFDDVVVFSR